MNVSNDVRFCQVKLALRTNFFRLCGGHVIFYGEFDPGSGRTLAACLTHASRTMKPSLRRAHEFVAGLVADGRGMVYLIG